MEGVTAGEWQSIWTQTIGLQSLCPQCLSVLPLKEEQTFYLPYLASLVLWPWIHLNMNILQWPFQFYQMLFWPIGLSRWRSAKESTCWCRRHKRCGFDPWVGKIPWSRKWQLTLAFLPRKFHGQRSLGATAHRVTKSQTELSAYTHTHTHTHFDLEFNVNVTKSKLSHFELTVFVSCKSCGISFLWAGCSTPKPDMITLLEQEKEPWMIMREGTGSLFTGEWWQISRGGSHHTLWVRETHGPEMKAPFKGPRPRGKGLISGKTLKSPNMSPQRHFIFALICHAPYFTSLLFSSHFKEGTAFSFPHWQPLNLCFQVLFYIYTSILFSIA